MKRYTDLELSKKLDALGCKSESEFWYIEDPSIAVHSINHESEHYNDTPAFEFEDFAGPSEHAWKNLVRVCLKKYLGANSDYMQLFKEDLSCRGADWIAIIKEALK